MKNNNKQAVKRLSVRSLRANRMRNLVALIAIILTTFMISTVFSIGISFGKNINLMTKRLYGTTANIFLVHPTDEQFEYAKNLDGVQAAGLQYYIGSALGKTDKGKDLAISLLTYDESEWNNHISPCVANINGTYPQAENEIMLTAKALDQLGITAPQIGMNVKLKYRIGDQKVRGDFVLSGWFSEYDSTQSSGIALLSQAFRQANGLTLEDNARLCISCKTNSDGDSVYHALQEKIGEENKENLTSSYGSESSEKQNTLIVAATIVMIALFIVFSGYLLIYNIMYISVTKDICFFGMLKTIGTSPKQIKSIVFRQGFLLSIIGIPVGLLLGFAVSFGIVPLAIKAISADDLNSSALSGDVSFSPLIFIGAALFSLLTIAMSCRKPARIASRVSPIEAVKYTGISEKQRLKKRKSTNGGKLSKMAFHNIFREKKRAFVVFASLFMGTVTFLCVNSVFSSLDVKNYVKYNVPHDFEYQSSPPMGEVKFDSDFLAAIDSLDGIEYKEIIKADYAHMPFDEATFKPVLEEAISKYGDKLGTYDDLLFAMQKMSKKNEYGTWVIGTPEKYLEHLENFDIEAFERGETCVVGYGNYEELIGKTIDVTSEKTGITKSVKIVGCFKNSSECDFALFSYAVGTIEGVFVSDSLLNSICDDPVVTNISLDVDAKKEPAIAAHLKKLNDALTNQTFIYQCRSEVAEKFSASMHTMNVLMGGIAILLILIGIINFINVMATGIFTRRREFAVLESIGMTKSQIYRMLTLEGGYYALITCALILTLGSVAMALVGRAMPLIANYAEFIYPVSLVALLLAAICLICLCVPAIVYKLTATESVTDRLHSSDN